MADKTPEEFKKGDVILAKTPYSGSPIIEIVTSDSFLPGRTQVHFENGQVVEFFNGVPHNVQE